MLFQRCFANVETTSINVRRLNFHFQPNINVETTLMNVDDQRCFNVDSTLMCLLGMFSLVMYRFCCLRFTVAAPTVFVSRFFLFNIMDFCRTNVDSCSLVLVWCTFAFVCVCIYLCRCACMCECAKLKLLLRLCVPYQAKCKFLRLLSARIKIHQILVIFETTNRFFFEFYVTLQCHETQLFRTFLAKILYTLNKKPIKVQIW